MSEHQQRVREEKEELDAKRERLRQFMDSDKYAALPRQEQVRLKYQSMFMRGYSSVLAERISAFNEAGG